MINSVNNLSKREPSGFDLSDHNFLVHAHAKLPNPRASIRIYQTTLLLIDEEAITINFWDQLRDLKNSRANFSVIIIQNQSTQIESVQRSALAHLAYIDYVLHKTPTILASHCEPSGFDNCIKGPIPDSPASSSKLSIRTNA